MKALLFLLPILLAGSQAQADNASTGYGSNDLPFYSARNGGTKPLPDCVKARLRWLNSAAHCGSLQDPNMREACLNSLGPQPSCY